MSSTPTKNTASEAASDRPAPTKREMEKAIHKVQKYEEDYRHRYIEDVIAETSPSELEKMITELTELSRILSAPYQSSTSLCSKPLYRFKIRDAKDDEYRRTTPEVYKQFADNAENFANALREGTEEGTQ